MTDFTVTTHRTGELAPKDQTAAQALFDALFGADENTVWADGDWRVLVHTSAGILTSMVEIIERTVTVAGRPVRVGGIGSVGTLPEYRRRGHSTAALRVAAAFMSDTLSLPYALLVTGVDEIPFYGRLGWRVFPDPVTYDQPDGSIHTHDGVNMVLPLNSEPWPPGPVHLCGLPW